MTPRLALPFLATLLAACTTPATIPPVASAIASAPPPIASAVASAPAAPSLAPAQPPAEQDQRTVAAKLRLVPARPEVALGTRLPLALENVDDHDWRYFHPGGTNGCAQFRWSMKLIDARGTVHSDHYEMPGRMCAAVMIPGGWMTIAPGAPMHLTLDTRMVWYTAPAGLRTHPLGHELSPGDYELVVQTPTGEVRTKVRILGKAKP